MTENSYDWASVEHYYCCGCGKSFPYNGGIKCKGCGHDNIVPFDPENPVIPTDVTVSAVVKALDPDTIEADYNPEDYPDFEINVWRDVWLEKDPETKGGSCLAKSPIHHYSLEPAFHRGLKLEFQINTNLEESGNRLKAILDKFQEMLDVFKIEEPEEAPPEELLEEVKARVEADQQEPS